MVSVPAPVPMMLAILPPELPPSVRPNPLPVIVPLWLSVILPVPPMIEAALPSVTSPAYVPPVALLFNSAPPELIPVPFSVRPPVLVIV